ncbi:DUF1254 domain-containing protein [Mycolicibacterium sp.]|uniref:DUF1254 domain-containing protein n=1 Tax=Mycolicibacterium sp. TaxID=2320850 RepID=UPI0028AC0B58|nr:DUF1254 domain-containing protein [Mycolicibacterium sp.]
MRTWIVVLTALLIAALTGCGTAKQPPSASTPTADSTVPSVPSGPVTPDEARAIAKDAYIYGFPMVDSYRVQYSYFIDSASPEYKGPWNQVHSVARVFTPADTAVQTPNSDTPYSMLGADLRAEPLVLFVPPIDEDRYYSLQFIDGYTANFAYVGSRATGNDGGLYLLAGPGWTGQKPDGVKDVIKSATDFALVAYRTQLFGPDDIDNVRKIQAGYKAEPLSVFRKEKTTPAAPAVEWPKPLSPDDQKTSLRFFDLLDFQLGYAPTLPEEQDVRARFAAIGLTGDGKFASDKLDPKMQEAFEAGMADAAAEFAAFKKDKIDTGEVKSGDLFGSRDELGPNYLYRMAGAVIGIYANSKQEAMYPVLSTDSDGAALTGTDKYTLTFAGGQLPPVNAFWSVTMYKLPESQLVDNPINRYVINSPMLPDLVENPDGSLTLYVQNSPPESDKTANWLPAPPGPFTVFMRVYWPKPEALDGSWQPPKLVKVA